MSLVKLSDSTIVEVVDHKVKQTFTYSKSTKTFTIQGEDPDASATSYTGEEGEALHQHFFVYLDTIGEIQDPFTHAERPYIKQQLANLKEMRDLKIAQQSFELERAKLELWIAKQDFLKTAQGNQLIQ